MTKIEKLARHFATGGSAMGYKEVASLLGVSPDSASSILCHLEQSNGKKWQVTIERTPRRQITSMVLVGREKTISEELRESLISNPGLARLGNKELASRFSCSDRLISKICAELGLHKAQRDRRAVLNPDSTSGKIRAALEQNPSARNTALAKEFECTTGLVSQMRRKMGLPAGKPGPAPGRKQAPRPKATGTKSRPTWSDETPHLNRAAQFRQMWPAARNQERAQ